MRFYFVKTPKFLQKLFPNYYWKENTHDKVIYLTFDDGPVPEITPWVLQKLASYKAKATFFCVGDNIAKYPDIFKLIKEENHSIGNHTFNHLKSWKTSTFSYIENVEKTSKEIDKYIDQKTSNDTLLFRPPYGKIKKSQANILLKKGYKIIMWNVLSGDFDTTLSKENCLNNVLKNTESGSVVVFHDSEKSFKNLEFVLPKVLENFTKRGYSFKSL